MIPRCHIQWTARTAVLVVIFPNEPRSRHRVVRLRMQACHHAPCAASGPSGPPTALRRKCSAVGGPLGMASGAYRAKLRYASGLGPHRQGERR